VNFINGANGSGKSAILAAVQICLGAGAKRTHRARNLKELVRKEAGSNCAGAKVRVTLLNRGDDGFQRDVYGDTITVERSISLRGGYNGYKLLDDQLKEKSRSKRDLDAMLDQLNIQVENPVAVLDQEEAKKFLMGKEEDKYAFFIKATELERLDQTYASAVDNIQDLEETKNRVSSSMVESKANVKKLYKEWQEFQELEKLEDKILDDRVLFAWSAYNVLNGKVHEQEKIAREIDTKLAKRQQELEKAESTLNVTDDEENVLKERMNRLTEEAKEAAGAKSNLEAELKKANAPLKKRQQDLSHMKREENNAKKRLKDATRHLQDARNQVIAAAGSAKTEEARRIAKIQKAEQTLAQARDQVDPLQESISLSLQKYEQLEPHVDQAKHNVSQVQSQLYAVSKKVKDLKSSSGGNSLAVFGQKCAAMRAKVDSMRRKFRGPVVGPLGAYLKIVEGKEHLAKIAESAIGGGLDRFIVTNDEDRALFMKLRRDVNCSSRECGVNQMHQGPRYKIPPPPLEGIETVASVLSISDDLAFNCLVDMHRIDVKALATSKEESEEKLLIQESSGREFIRGGKVKEVFFLPNGDYWQVKNGNRIMISSEKKLRQSIGVDRTAAIEAAAEEEYALNEELTINKKKEAELLNEYKGYKIQWNKDQRTLRAINQQIEKMQSAITELKAEADEAENVTIDTTELEEDVKSAEDSLAELKEKQAEVEKAIEELLPNIRDVKSRLEETTARNEKVLEDMTVAEAKIEEYVKGHTERNAAVEKKRAKLQQITEVREKQKEVVQEATEKKDESLLKARLMTHKTKQDREKKKRAEEAQAGDGEQQTREEDTTATQLLDSELVNIEPVSTKKEPSYYKARIERAVKQIERERERRQMSERDPVVALEKFQRAKKSLDAKLIQIETIEKNVNALISDIKERKKRWKLFRAHIAFTTNITFDEMLNKKGSSGQIEFLHEDRRLKLVVQKDNTNEMSQTKDVKALSGGERSFTTLSLLLALGESLETPFRVMDEFDVFLDPVSRKIALDTMVAVAKELEHRQFIFITPQDLSSLKPDRMLKIFKLKPPERNSIGGPSQQTLDFEPPARE